MEQRAKGRRSVGSGRSGVQEEPAQGRASGAAAAGLSGRAARAPRHSEPLGAHSLRRPHRPSTGPGRGSGREQPGEGPERTRQNTKGTTRRRRPLPAGPVGKRDGGRGRGCRAPGEKKTGKGLPLARVRLWDGGARCPTGRRLPYPGQHHPAKGPPLSHRHRSHRHHRSGEAGSSPPLGD